ncbi:MAG TPA: GNAT family N-acetyltransferase [Chloroflexota bacterium]
MAVDGVDDVVAYRQVEGEKTRLRPALWGFSEDELRRRYKWSLDEDLQYWSGTIPGGRSYTQFRETVAQRDWPNDNRRISYAILDRDGDLIGMVSCYNVDHDRGTGELGVYIGEQGLWGQGYGTDAVTTFLWHLFDDLGFRTVYLHTHEANIRAQRSYIAIGFETVNRRRRYSSRLGYHDELEMTISCERFKQLHTESVPSAST